MLRQLDIADSVRREVAPSIAQKHKADLGQFMTPSSVARFMASLFPPSTLQTCRLLDAGAGVGALSCAFLDRWVTPIKGRPSSRPFVASGLGQSIAGSAAKLTVAWPVLWVMRSA
jgi:hypothetical protein